ncbi:MAG: hypothetical protein CSA70_11810 [Rhodobacterales bacterium]|nr:MAG: hypothetical protein CSA70_11810 [Rhodobacterales bacterium]
MKKATAAIGLMALSACAADNHGTLAFNHEAGALLGGADFGNSTMNNNMVMNGERSYVFDLSNRFANEVMSTVNFAFNSSQLDAGARDTLREQARWIRQFPEVRFRVYGHADAPGSNSYNKRLGMRRAQAVVSYLASQGISRSRLEAVASFGETQPLVVTQGRERRNRRTVTEVSGFVRNHPTVLDGQYARIIHRGYVESAKPASDLSGIKGADFKTTQ